MSDSTSMLWLRKGLAALDILGRGTIHTAAQLIVLAHAGGWHDPEVRRLAGHVPRPAAHAAAGRAGDHPAISPVREPAPGLPQLSQLPASQPSRCAHQECGSTWIVYRACSSAHATWHAGPADAAALQHAAPLAVPSTNKSATRRLPSLRQHLDLRSTPTSHPSILTLPLNPE